jgi:hypothetical protein
MVRDRVRDTSRQGGHPSGCKETDCYYYDKEQGYCNNCKWCAICGRNLYDGKLRERAHLFKANTKGGKKWVPACPICNKSQQTKGLVTWLRWLHKNKREEFDRIVHNQRWRMYKKDFIRDKVLRLAEELK